MKQFLFILLLATSFVISNAQTLVTGNCRQSYKSMLELNFEKAAFFIEKEKNENPDNVYIYYLESYIDFLKVFISEDETLFDHSESKKDIAIEKIGRLPETSPYRNYLIANINLQWAFARIKFGEYFAASIEINRAYRLIEKNMESFPGFYPNKISHAVLKIIVGLVPEKYTWVLDLISMQGSVEDGTAELYEVLGKTETDSTYSYLNGECLFYLGFVELNINPDKTNSLRLLDRLLPLSDSSLLFNYMCINILTKSGKSAQAEVQFRKLDEPSSFYPFYFLDYLRADYYLKKLETDSAKKYYVRFLKNFNGKNYIKDAWRKTAWAFLMEGKPDEYLQLMSAVGNSGYADIGIDKDAQLEYDKGNVPNPSLIKARLLFDGFFYVLADSVLNAVNSDQLDFEQLMEKDYRHGRIKHESMDYENAKKYYKRVIAGTDLTTEYFPANSALKLAEIYELQDSLTLSHLYYKKCLEMNFDQFENSIKSKAREGVRRVDRKEQNK
ncbi:MAG: hypothetical protein GXO88_12070 [Chlorobi bacterium]|nr:hypothetical protein [Chlorobiota bacterium]